MNLFFIDLSAAMAALSALPFDRLLADISGLNLPIVPLALGSLFGILLIVWKRRTKHIFGKAADERLKQHLNWKAPAQNAARPRRVNKA